MSAVAGGHGGTEGRGGTWRGHPHPEQQGSRSGPFFVQEGEQRLDCEKVTIKAPTGKEIQLQRDHMNLGKRLLRCLT